MTFTGSVRDLGSGLQYMSARYYDPATGRFVSQDTYTGTPYAPWTQHLYSYCGNNPVNMVDPTGHMPEMLNGRSIYGALMGRLRHDFVVMEVNRYLTSQGARVFNNVEIPGASSKGNGNIGKPDIYAVKGGMTYIWEVKPRSPYGRGTGNPQLKRYVDQNQKRGIPTKRGYALETLKQVTIGDEVLYLTYENGVIYYSLSDSEDYKPQNIKHGYVDMKGTLKKFKDMIREEIRKRSMTKNKAQGKEGKGGEIISSPNVEVPDTVAAFGLGLLAGAGLLAFGSHGNDRQTQYAR